ncbi:hypothetical protein TNCV_3205711 [Trichonephila clavipes]|nr:hypothetical protein TNCV_3205711 [Trichonephila clavipes]
MVCQYFGNFSIPSAKNCKGRQSRTRSTSFMTSLFERKIMHQDKSADVKTDSNPKMPHLDCLVDDASNLTPVCRTSTLHGPVLVRSSH